MNPRITMKRRIVMLLIFLLLGAIVNIAVAWGLELRPPKSFMEMLASAPCGFEWRSTAGNATWLEARAGQMRITQSVRWKRSVESSLPVRLRAPIDQVESLSLIPSWSAFSEHDPAEDYLDALQPDLVTSFTEHSSGWPALALRFTCVKRYVQTFATGPQEYIHRCDGVIFPERWHTTEHIALPMRPIWTGFAINATLYAVLLWLLFSARNLLPYARRRRRIKRGLCPACAYPVGTSDLCTECGTPVTKEHVHTGQASTT